MKNKRKGIVQFRFSFDIFVGAMVVLWHFFFFVSFVDDLFHCMDSFFVFHFVYFLWFVFCCFVISTEFVETHRLCELKRENMRKKSETNTSDKCDWKRKPIENKAFFFFSFFLFWFVVCCNSTAEVKLKSFPI